MAAQALLGAVQWLHHASFRVAAGGQVLYIDPWQVAGAPRDGTLILVTHGHHDHLSAPDIRRVAAPGATLAVGGAQDAPLPPDLTPRPMAPGDTLRLGAVQVRAHAAYNVDKDYHPRAQGHVGYLINTPQGSLYFAGDTDDTPELRAVRADIVFVPVGGVYTMDAAQAAAAVNEMGPAIAVPMHYGYLDSVAGVQAAQEFLRLLAPGVQGRLLQPAQ